MNPQIYLFDISRCTSTADLLAMAEDAKADDSLSMDEKAEICAAVTKRCLALTRNPKPRFESI